MLPVPWPPLEARLPRLPLLLARPLTPPPLRLEALPRRRKLRQPLQHPPRVAWWLMLPLPSARRPVLQL